MKAVAQAAQSIMLGDADIIVAGNGKHELCLFTLKISAGETNTVIQNYLRSRQRRSRLLSRVCYGLRCRSDCNRT
jgi:acetyl-CoA acetyltransferase